MLSICPSVCPSMTLCTVAKRHILPQKCLSKLIGSANAGTRFYILPTPMQTLSRHTSHILNRRHRCHLANKLKRNCERAKTVQISTSGIAIVSMLHGYSRQHCTTGSFSATAAVLVVALWAGACSGGRCARHDGGTRQSERPRPRTERSRPVRVLTVDGRPAWLRLRHQTGQRQDLRQGWRARPRTVAGQLIYLTRSLVSVWLLLTS